MVTSSEKQEAIKEEAHEGNSNVFASDEEYAKAVLAAWGEPIPNVWEQEKLKYFRAVEHAGEIQALARGLSLEEITNYYGLVPSILPEYDALYLVANFLKGRIKAKADAVTNLFNNMLPSATGANNASLQASLTYLQTFSSSFKSLGEVGKNIPKAIKIELVD